MNILRKTLILFLLVVLCHGADYRAVLRTRQASDGLWRDGNNIDMVGTLFALTALDASSGPEDQAAAQRTRAAIFLNCQEDGSLLGALPFLLASHSEDIFQLYTFRDNDGWMQEPGAASDWANTLLMLLLAPNNEYTLQDCSTLLSNGPLDNTRYSLLLLFTYMRHELQPPCDLLRLLDTDIESLGYFEQALALCSFAKLSRWDAALKLREHLLASQLSEGGWGEAAGLPFDLVTTSLAILALDCFHVNENTLSPDLSLDENTTRIADDNGSSRITAVVSNTGSVPAGEFQLSVSALTSTETLHLASTTISYLAPGKSQLVSLPLSLPNDCAAILLEADPIGTTGDSHRENNSLHVMLSETLQSLLPGEILFDWRKPIYPYYLNPGFGAIASISILFPFSTTSIIWKWMCDGSIFSTGRMECPDAHQPLLLTAECFPPEGKHTISIEISQTNGSTNHTLEASMDIHVLYDSCALFCHAAKEVDNRPHGPFHAREEVVFEAFCSNPNATANVSIFDSLGTYIGNAAAEMRPGRFHWNTEALAPGHYKAIGQFWDYDSMDIPMEAECLFDIAPSSTSLNLVIHAVTDKNTGFRFYEGLSCSPAVSLGWETAANTPTTCLFSWEIRNESESIVTPNTIPITISADLSSLRQWKLLELPDILFERAATYTLHIQMTANDQTLHVANSIEVGRRPGIVVENRLYHPDATLDETGLLCLPPSNGTSTVVTDIFRLSIQDASFSIPYNFQCDTSPLYLHDTPENSVIINLDAITNAIGNAITSGWLVCQTPYGFLSGENNLTPDWTYGSTIAIPIHNGTASFTYTPQGDSSNETSLLIPIEIFPYESGNSFDFRRIGVVEIFLTNQL